MMNVERSPPPKALSLPKGPLRPHRLMTDE